MARALNRSRGALHHAAKLDEAQVRELRALIAQREQLLAAARALNDRALGQRFGVHPNSVWKIAARAAWAHLRR